MVSWPLPWRRGIFLLVCFGCFSTVMTSEESGDGYLNQFAVRLTAGSRATVEEVAKEHGFIVKRELPHINVYLLEHPNVHHRAKRSAQSELQRLQNDKRISYAQQEVILHREKRRNIIYDKQLELPVARNIEASSYERTEIQDIDQRDNIFGASLHFDDPMYKDQWYLVNKGQTGGERRMDMGVSVVWESGITGKGVKVTILDDGIDHKHLDLKDNYDPKASIDLNGKTKDPMPDKSKPDNSHGTRCAGEVAAAANNVCGVGVAYEASIGGVRILDGPVTDSLEAEALSFNNNYIDIYSASWGPKDNGETMEAPQPYTLEALQKGVIKGRNGLGSIFVWATGNGGWVGDDCSADGYVSRPETLGIGSVNEMGRSPFFTENCTSTLAVVPSGGDEYIGEKHPNGVKIKVVTTDFNNGCIENFQGTSSAAPLAAGCIALVLQANPKLGWRDVQHIVVRGARIPSADTSWTINGAGYHISHRFGFGVMDCGKMVELAQTWNKVPERRMCSFNKTNYQLLKKNDHITDSIEINGCPDMDDNAIDSLEHVQVHVNMSTEARGDNAFVLVSPSGTYSKLLSPRTKDKYNGKWAFTFMTVHCWEENPNGKWTLIVLNYPYITNQRNKSAGKVNKMSVDEDNTVGYIAEWGLTLYGTHGIRHGRNGVKAKREQKAYRPKVADVEKIKRQEIELSKRVSVKRSDISTGESSNVENEKLPGLSDTRDLVKKLYSFIHGRKVETSKKGFVKPYEKKNVDKRKSSDTQSMVDMLDHLVSVIQRAVNEDKSFQ